MAQSGLKSAPARISGQVIINELLRNMQLGQLELGYSFLVPCIFSIYLHPDDHARLNTVQEIIREDARKALNAWLALQNAKGGLLRRNAQVKTYRIARNEWWIEFFADTESAVPPGDVEIHSELNDTAQPGHRGVKTTLVGRDPSVTSVRVGRDRESTRLISEKVFGEIRYQDDSGSHIFLITQDAVSIGRGGDDLWVDLTLYTSDEISREHARLRRDVAGAFFITDKSRNGTWLNGRRLKRDVEVALPERTEIGLAEVVKLSFETRHA